MMIPSRSMFSYSGAKVRSFVGICKETGGAGQNLICNPLSVSGLFSRRAAESTEYDTEVYFITHHILFFYHEFNELHELFFPPRFFLPRISRIYSPRILFSTTDFTDFTDFFSADNSPSKLEGVPERRGSIIGSLREIPTLPTLTLSISGLQTRYPTLEATLTPTLENLSTNFSVQPLSLQFSRELGRYDLY